MKWYQNKAIIIFFLIFFFPVGLFLMWKYTDWGIKRKSIISAIVVIIVIFIGIFDQPDTVPKNTSISSASTTSQALTVDSKTSLETTTFESTSLKATTTTPSTSKISSTVKSKTSKSSTSNKTNNYSNKVTSTSKPKTDNSDHGDGKTIYATPKGKRYHYDPNCAGKNSEKISWNDVSLRGLTPCQKCAN